MSESLNAQMIAAHEAGDQAALIRLYTRAADAANDEDAACFYLTHAYVFALEAGADEVDGLKERLVAAGRDR
ncbi:MAG: hypothetical protein AAF412_01670 [Pseudomonadota bacterium]